MEDEIEYMPLTGQVLRSYYNRVSGINNIAAYKRIGRHLRDRYHLSDIDALTLLRRGTDSDRIIAEHNAKCKIETAPGIEPVTNLFEDVNSKELDELI